MFDMQFLGRAGIKTFIMTIYCTDLSGRAGNRIRYTRIFQAGQETTYANIGRHIQAGHEITEMNVTQH